jgi:chromosome segregation ATPase
MNQQVSVDEVGGQSSTSIEDADRIEAVISGFIAACAQKLFQTRVHVEKRAPRLSPLTIGLTLVVAVLSSGAAIILFTNDASLLQIILSSIGEVFLFVMVAMSGLMDLQGNHKRFVKREIETELAKCQEMASSMSGLAKLRSQWNKSIFASEIELAGFKRQIEQAGSEFEEKRQLLDEVSASIELAQNELHEILASLSRSKEEAAGLSKQSELLYLDLEGLKEQLSIKNDQLTEVSGLVEAKHNQLDLVSQQHNDKAAELASLQARNSELAGDNDDLTLKSLELQENVAKLEAMALELSSVDKALSERRLEHDTASRVYDAMAEQRKSLSAELELVRSQLDQSRSELLRLDGEMQRVQCEISVAQQERYGVAAAIAAQHAQGDELAKQLNELRCEIDRRQIISDQITEGINNDQHTQAILSRTIGFLRRKSIRYKTRIAQSRLLSHQFAIEIQDRLSARQQIEQCLAELQDQVAAANDELVRLEPSRFELLALRHHQEEATSVLNDQRQAIESGAGELARCQADVLRISDQLAAMEAERNALLCEITELHSSKASSQNEADRIEAELTALRNELETLTNDRQGLIEANEQLMVSKQTIETQISDHEQLRIRFAAEHLSLVEQESGIRTAIAHLEKDLQSMREQYEAADRLMIESIAKCDELRELSTELDERNRKSVDEYARISEHQESINTEITNVRAENSRLQMKAVALKAQETSLRGEIEELTLTRDRLVHEAADAEGTLTELNSQAERLRESLRGKDAIRLQILKLTEEKEILSGQVNDANEVLVCLTDRITESNRIADELSTRISEAEDQVKRRRDVLASHQQEIKEKQSLFEDLLNQIADSQGRLGSVQDEYQRLVEEREQLEGVNQLLQVDNERLQIDQKDYLQVVESRKIAESQLADLQQQIDDREMKVNEMNDEIQLGQRRLEQDKSDIEQMMNDKIRLNDELQEFQRKLTEAAERRDELKAEAEAFVQRSESLRETICQLEYEVDRLDAVKRESELIKKRNLDLESEILTKQQNVRESEGRIQALQKQSETFTGLIAKLDEDRRVKENDLRQLTLQAESQLQTLSDSQRRQEAAEQVLANLKNSIESLESSVSDREEEFHRLDRSIQASLTEKRLLESDLEQMKATVATWTSQAYEAERNLAELDLMRAEQSKLALSINEEQSTLQATQMRLNEITDARDLAQKELEAIEAAVEASKASIDDIRITAGELTDQVGQLARSKKALEEELSRCEAELDAKQQEISTIESRDKLRHSLATKDLEEAAIRLADTERRLAIAKESLRAQEVNVSEAVAVSQQWDSYIVSLRAKWEELQQANLNSNQDLQSVVAEKLRAEGELTDAKRRLSESETLADNAKRQLEGIETEIAAATNRQTAMETAMETALARLQSLTHQSQQQISDQQRQIEAQAASIRSITDEISEKKQKLSELVVAEGRLIERCSALEESIRQSQAAQEAAEKANAALVAEATQRIVFNTTPIGNVESAAVPQEDLLQEIESLVDSIDQPISRSIPMTAAVVDAVTILPKASQTTSQSKQTPPDPWASVFE